MAFELNFFHNGNSTDNLTVSISDIRDLIFAFQIPDEEQMIDEINTILACIERRSRLKQGSLTVEKQTGTL